MILAEKSYQTYYHGIGAVVNRKREICGLIYQSLSKPTTYQLPLKQRDAESPFKIFISRKKDLKYMIPKLLLSTVCVTTTFHGHTLMIQAHKKTQVSKPCVWGMCSPSCTSGRNWWERRRQQRLLPPRWKKPPPPRKRFIPNKIKSKLH